MADEQTPKVINWVFFLEQGIALAIALATTFLNSRGRKVTPQDLAANAQKYMSEGAKDLSSSGDAYLGAVDQ